MAYSLIANVGIPGGQTGGTSSNIDTTGADLIVITSGWYSIPFGDITLSDSKSNTWSQILVENEGSGLRMKVWYAAAPTVGSGHNFTLAATAEYPQGTVSAWSGAHASPLDQSTKNNAAASTIQAGSLTPVEDNCLVIACAANLNVTSFSSINGGFTTLDLLDGDGDSEASYMAYLIQTTAAAANPTWTFSGSGNMCAALVSFKSAAGGGGGTTRGMPFGARGTAFNGGRTFQGNIR